MVSAIVMLVSSNKTYDIFCKTIAVISLAIIGNGLVDTYIEGKAAGRKQAKNK